MASEPGEGDETRLRDCNANAATSDDDGEDGQEQSTHR